MKITKHISGQLHITADKSLRLTSPKLLLVTSFIRKHYILYEIGLRIFVNGGKHEKYEK